MNGKRYFAFVGSPGSLHKVVADIVWSSLQVEKICSTGRIDFDAGQYDDLNPCSLSNFYGMLSVMARLVPAVIKTEQPNIVCTGHPKVRIPCISSYSCEIPVGLAWQCVQSLNAPDTDLLFVVDASDEILRGRVGATKRDWNGGVLERISIYYRELKESESVVRLDTSEGPKGAADKALERIRKVL